jgi:hypothetical protein
MTKKKISKKLATENTEVTEKIDIIHIKSKMVGVMVRQAHHKRPHPTKPRHQTPKGAGH